MISRSIWKRDPPHTESSQRRPLMIGAIATTHLTRRSSAAVMITTPPPNEAPQIPIRPGSTSSRFRK